MDFELDDSNTKFVLKRSDAPKCIDDRVMEFCGVTFFSTVNLFPVLEENGICSLKADDIKICSFAFGSGENNFEISIKEIRKLSVFFFILDD